MMRNGILNVKKHSELAPKLVHASLMAEKGIKYYFEKTFDAINASSLRSDILEAIKKDADKYGDMLTKVAMIIKSIQNDVVTEFVKNDGLLTKDFYTIEDVFGSCYNKQEGTITLCGISFPTDGNLFIHDKEKYSDRILGALLGVNRKELMTSLAAVKRYEEEMDEVKKAITSPGIILAEKIIKNVSNVNIAYIDFRSKMTAAEIEEYKNTFKRTGIDGVIQDSTYIDFCGVKQVSKQHSMFKNSIDSLKVLLVDRKLKYIESVEIDGDGDIDKALHVVNLLERFTLNTETKATYKFRKLGNYKANGIFMSSYNLVCFDTRTMSAVLHEWAHKIEADIRRRAEESDINAKAIVKFLDLTLIPTMQKRINYENLPELKGKDGYYSTPTEVVARACEIAGVFARDKGEMIIGADELEIIKPKSVYIANEGIYFDFTTFSDTEIAMVEKLYELFFETSPDQTIDLEFDNFIKIDTQFKRKRVSFDNILRREAKKAVREQQALYSMVTSEYIQYIFDNKSRTVSAYDLASSMLANVAYLGGTSTKGTAEYWAEVTTDKVKVLKYVFEQLEAELDDKEFYQYLLETKRELNKIDTYVLLSGFSKPAFKTRVKDIMKTSGDFENWDNFKSYVIRASSNPLSFLKAESLADVEFVKELVAKNGAKAIRTLDNSEISEELFLEIWNEFNKSAESIDIFLPKRLKNNFEAALSFLKQKGINSFYEIGEDLTNDSLFMTEAINFGMHFAHCGKSLLDNKGWVIDFVRKDSKNAKFISQRLQMDQEILNLFDPLAFEIETAMSTSLSAKRKLAQKTSSSKTIEILAKEKDEEIRMYIASNAATSSEILTKYSKLKSYLVRSRIAANPNTDNKTFKTLLNDEEYDVLAGCAKNPFITKKEAEMLAKCGVMFVQWNLICNNKVNSVTVIKRCLLNNEDSLIYEMKYKDEFSPSAELLYDMSQNAANYLFEESYSKALSEVAKFKLDRDFPDYVPKEKKEVVEIVKSLENDEVENDVDFEALLRTAVVKDFPHTQTGKLLPMFEIPFLGTDKFKEFSAFLKDKGGIAKYSSFAKGYIIYNMELFNEYRNVAATVTAIYSADMLATFANGTLF